MDKILGNIQKDMPINSQKYITDQLKLAIEMNRINPKKREWNSINYRNKYILDDN